MDILKELKTIKENNNHRSLKTARINGANIEIDGKKALNLASNDYLGIASDESLRQSFLEQIAYKNIFFGAGASRLIYSAGDEYESLESWFNERFANKKALIFNSGYSANFAFISCFGDADTLFLADKLVHASMIDALKSANFKRFKHNDANDLARLLEQNKDKYKQIIVLCESLYSMDGDYAPLIQFRKLCDSFGALLYVDEAHSFFALNELGECDKQGVRADFMLFTLSKAAGGYGAVLLADEMTRDFLINKARALIYSTAIAPVNAAWANFVLNTDFSSRRENLRKNVEFLALSRSQIAPFICKSSAHALSLSKRLLEHGYFVPALRPPTVKEPRLRISLRADIETCELAKLKEILNEI